MKFFSGTIQILSLSIGMLVSCTFGSIGDTNKENLIILQNLIYFNRETRSPLNSQFQFFGDEIDNLPERFSLRSNNRTFQIEVLGDSFVTWEFGSFRINPPSSPFSNREMVAKTHTPFTVPLDLPITDPYARSYSFLAQGTESLRKTAVATTVTGFTHVSTQTRTNFEAPLGNVSLITVSWEELVFRFSSIGSSTKDVRLILRPGTQVIRPKCRIEASLSKTVPIVIAFQYGNLFRDRTDSGSANAILTSIDSLANNDIVISSVSQTELYEAIRKNLVQEDLSFFLPRCIPGAVL